MTSFELKSGNMPVKIERANVEDATTIFELINKAYSVEAGSDGVAFKNCDRLLSPLHDGLTEQHYEQGLILKALSNMGKIVGVMVWKLVPSRVEEGKQDIYFGPFSVSPNYKGKGIGKALMRKVFELGQEAGAVGCEIWVINHRADLFPMYHAMGFEDIAEAPYPHPERLLRPSHFIILRRPSLQF